MKTVFWIGCLSCLLGVMPTVVQAQEYWGAYAEGGKYWEGGEAFGLAWNFPSPERAINSAIKECLKHRQCAANGVHKLHVFSTSAKKNKRPARFSTNYGPQKGIFWKWRCIAIEGLGNDYQAAFGNTKSEARAEHRGKQDYIETVECNAH